VNENEMETMLYEMLQDEDAAPEVKRVRTFAEVGVLTNNAGLVITTADGGEFQLTIIRSR
jgi:hypothetical protein